MVNRKGFIRTIEAVIAILLILGFVLIMKPNLSNNQDNSIPSEVEETEKFIFSEITYNKDFRDCITNENPSNPETGTCKEVCNILDEFVSSHKPFGYGYECEICESSVSCMSNELPIDRNIYANSIFLAAKNSKIVRVYYFPENPS